MTKYQIDLISYTTSKHLDSWLELSEFPQYAKKWFLLARNEAFKSDFSAAKLGCVIVYKNHVIGKGHNKLKTDPIQKRYNEKYRDWNITDDSNLIVHSLHAEIDAIKHIPYPVMQKLDWKHVEVYIFRVAPGLEGCTGLALPCPACAHALQDLGIQKVYYTTGHLDKPFGCCDL